MSTAADQGRFAWLRSAGPYVLLGIALVLTVLVTGGPPDQGLPLDPRSPGPNGTKALVDVLRELGVEVDITSDVSGARTALLLADDLDEPARERLRAWVADGGRLIVADPFSPLAPEVASSTALGFTNPSIAPGNCPVEALADVGRVTVPNGAVYETPADAVGCYPRNEGAWLVARSEGEGTIVSVGGPGTFTNIELGDEDNAVLAAMLLAPGPVAFVEPPSPGGGDARLLDLVAPGVRWAIVQLLIAFGVVVLWRARRLGRPVVEAAPVEVPGSELVVAFGNLMQTSGAAGHAAGVLRSDARRVLGERLGLPSGALPEVLADTAAARTGARAEKVLAAVGPPDGPEDDDRLVALGRVVEDVRRAILTAPERQEQ